MRLAVLAALSAVALLTGCDDEPKKTEEQVKIYASVEACRADHSEAECAKAFEGAKDTHTEKAPRYEHRSSCEDIYGPGQCVPRRDGDHDTFMPLMTGFLLGHMMSGGIQSQPIYVDRDRRAYSYGGGGSAYVGSYGGTYVARSPGAPSPSGAAASVWSSGAYKPQTVTVIGGMGGSASIGGKPMASSGIASGSVARGGFGGSASAAARSSGG